MLFNTFLFVAFFAGVLAAHWAMPHRARNAFLLAASYVFYASWDWRFLALIWFSTLLDYGVGRALGSLTAERSRRFALLVSVVGNLTLLGFFKYYNFFVDSLDALLAPFGASGAGLHLDLVLPLGISFYTFQTMSYTIDVYRGSLAPVKSLPDFALFVCFFPQLIAGPIERAGHLVPQIQRHRRLSADDLHQGFALAMWGLFKKVVIADNLARVVDPIYELGAPPSGERALLATLAFTLQVYADFSSYTDIARGTARLLGFRLSENFRMPYFARDMGEFWRRWHVTLSSWLRDYLYIPLGGNVGRESRVAFNLFLTLFLAGLWHGSDGTFFFFGAYHGLLVVLARGYRKSHPVRPGSSPWPGALLTVFLFFVGLVLFRSQTLGQALEIYGAMLFHTQWGGWGWWEASAVALISVCGLVLMGFDALRRRFGDELFVLGWPLPARVLVYLGVFYAIVLTGRAEEVPFVYFQF
jgi:D-alanyl-lipoteichoic acid acyltransferase DltB (MBOAT superfamily)